MKTKNTKENTLTCCTRFKLSLNFYGIGFLCCCLTEKSRKQERDFEEFQDEIEIESILAENRLQRQFITAQIGEQKYADFLTKARQGELQVSDFKQTEM